MNRNASSRPLIGDQMDALPVTRRHLLAVVLCGFGFAVDTFEIAFGSVLSTIFSTPPQVATPTALAVLLASVYVGATFGAPLVGGFADRYGRRAMIRATLLWIAVFSLLSAAAPGIGSLTVCRALAGFALGAFPPIATA
jgi:putative MFS transporter